MTRVFIVEDNKEISSLLSSFLERQGYQVRAALDGMEARDGLKDKNYDIVLMDLMLPFISGETLIKELREYSDVPVIVLSAKSIMDTRLEVLRAGADDYILKPFDLNEVLARIEVVLRRSGKDKGQEKGAELRYLGLRLFPEEHKAEFEGKPISFTKKEILILQLFFENPSKTFTKANIYEAVWGEDYCYEDNTVNVHMSNLRNKLKKETSQEIIETVWGIGYRLKSAGK